MPPRRHAPVRAAVAIAIAAGVAGAQAGPEPDRRRAADPALTFRGFYTADVLANLAGGRRRGVDALGNVDLVLDVDLDASLGWRGGSARLHAIGTHGGSFSDRVGDTQIVSSIEAPAAVRPFEAWLEQGIDTAQASLRVGLQDVNAEFDVLPSAGLFVNSSYGFGAEFGSSGRAGPSSFPVTSLAARVGWRPSPGGYVRALVADGVPGDPRDPEATAVRFDGDDGILFALELGTVGSELPEVLGRTRVRLAELPLAERPRGWFHKYAIGVHGYTDGLGTDRDRGAVGVHLLAEQSLYVEPDAPDRGLVGFARLAWAEDAIGPFDAFASLGLVYRGLSSSRPDDRLGLAIAVARFGGDRRDAPIARHGRAEINVELTWRARVTDWLTLQPDLQYVHDPGGDPALDDAWVVGIRGIVSF